jgi:hypothetical protein
VAEPTTEIAKYGAGGLVTLIVTALLRPFLRFLAQRATSGEAALRETITVLREQLAVAQADKVRLEATVAKLGGEKDKLHKLEIWAAGVVVRAKENPAVDDALVEDPPTGVHDTAKLLERKTSSTPPKGTPVPQPGEQSVLLPDGRRYRQGPEGR